MKSLKTLRKRKGITLEYLAKEVGLASVSISLIEKGKSNPNRVTRRKLEHFFGESINWLDVPPIAVTPRKRGSTWTETENEFRLLLKLIAGLPQEQREEFITLMKRHMRLIK